jgi:hypothetical protein
LIIIYILYLRLLIKEVNNTLICNNCKITNKGTRSYSLNVSLKKDARVGLEGQIVNIENIEESRTKIIISSLYLQFISEVSTESKPVSETSGRASIVGDIIIENEQKPVSTMNLNYVTSDLIEFDKPNGSFIIKKSGYYNITVLFPVVAIFEKQPDSGTTVDFIIFRTDSSGSSTNLILNNTPVICTKLDDRFNTSTQKTITYIEFIHIRIFAIQY